MGSYKRFTDENYKNWLKTVESLNILRSKILPFVENETETYHSSLLKTLQEQKCTEKCSLKKGPPKKLCAMCERWKKEILRSYDGRVTGVHWNNCDPYLWPTEKWEVAKVFMPGGQKEHCHFDHFDIAAILNFMAHCKHFQQFIKSQPLLKHLYECDNHSMPVSVKFLHKHLILLYEVINVRNTLMHSPDFSLNKEKMNECIKNILNLAEGLESRIPKLHQTKLHQTIKTEIQQFDAVLENYPPQPSKANGSSENMRLLEGEQQALKEKIAFLTQLYETDQHTEIKGELQGMKDFLDQNKDLLEKLKPQLDQLNEMQQRVNKHEDQIDELNTRVDDLEKVTQDSVFIDDTLMFKNHLFEKSKKRKWPEPNFTEESEANGYRGQVEVNGRIFTGSQVFKSKKRAHQEVAKIALESLKSEFESMEDLSASAAVPLVTATSSTSILFYGTVTLVLKKEICSEEFAREEEAIESAYMKLAQLFDLNKPEGDDTFRKVVLAHFGSFKLPLEILDHQNDKISCKLQLRNDFTFHDEEGATAKKKAEQQAAKVALQQLSRFLNYSVPDTSENYKGFLKERLEALGLDSPEYKTEQKNAPEEAEGPRASSDNSHNSSTETRQHKQENASLQPQDNAADVQPPSTTPRDCAAVSLISDIRDPSPSPTPKQVDMGDYTEISSLLAIHHLKPPSVTVDCVSNDQNFRLSVDIRIVEFTFPNKKKYTSKKDATRNTYYLLGQVLGICQPNTDINKVTMLVKQDFSQKSLTHPNEDIKEDKGFSCSLTGITYNLVYDGQGSTEAEAKLDALQKAWRTLPLLFGFETLPTSSNAKDLEAQINELLKNADQQHLTFSFKPCQHKISLKLQFQDYTMASKSQRTKKDNRNHLSKRILGLLGEETEKLSSSLRNCLDDWFKRKSLQQPLFEDTEEAQGSKATFSVDLTCTHPDWEENLKEAEEKLVQELVKRFKYLTDQNEEE